MLRSCCSTHALAARCLGPLCSRRVGARQRPPPVRALSSSRNLLMGSVHPHARTPLTCSHCGCARLRKAYEARRGAALMRLRRCLRVRAGSAPCRCRQHAAHAGATAQRACCQVQGESQGIGPRGEAVWLPSAGLGHAGCVLPKVRMHASERGPWPVGGEAVQLSNGACLSCLGACEAPVCMCRACQPGPVQCMHACAYCSPLHACSILYRLYISTAVVAPAQAHVRDGLGCAIGANWCQARATAGLL